MTYLSIHALSFALNSTFRIEDLNLEIDKGEMLGIIGPNGSGKTTLLKLVSGIYRPRTGSIRLGNSDIHDLARRELAHKRAYVPEGIDLPFDYTVHEIVALGRHPYTSIFPGLGKKDRTAIDKAFELTDTARLAQRKFFTLSMGEKQRVVLAMAIAQEPELLLLDEPISHLDIGHQLAFVHTLKQLNKNGITILSAMHELPLAMEFFGRLCLLENGKIVKAAPPGDSGLLESIKSVFGVSNEKFIRP